MLEAPISSVSDSRLLTCLEALKDVPRHDKTSKVYLLRRRVVLEVGRRVVQKIIDPALERRAEDLVF